jgi:hypothetical protein
MSRHSLVKPRLVIFLILASYELSASTGVTHVAGSCRPNLPSFATISAALAAAPAPSVVIVCPGSYTEQVEITQPVTLQGVVSGDSGQAIITVPGGGMVNNAMDANGNPLAAQVWVSSAAGPVNITDITFDAAGNGLGGGVLAAIFYQNSSGTVNHVTTRNQITSGGGDGMLIEGGASNPSVTVLNSSFHDFAHFAIEATTNQGAVALSATIKGNAVKVSVGFSGMVFDKATVVTITNNVVIGAPFGGVSVDTGSTGSISGNTLLSNKTGIFTSADGVSVTGNKILNGATVGIVANTPAATIQGNTIISTPTGINAGCFADGNLGANTIIDATTGVAFLLDGAATTNSYFDVATLRSGGC